MRILLRYDDQNMETKLCGIMSFSSEEWNEINETIEQTKPVYTNTHSKASLHIENIFSNFSNAPSIHVHLHPRMVYVATPSESSVFT